MELLHSSVSWRLGGAKTVWEGSLPDLGTKNSPISAPTVWSACLSGGVEVES